MMGWKDYYGQPLSRLRDWAREHERTLVLGGTWGLAAVFFIVAVIYLWKTIGSL